LETLEYEANVFIAHRCTLVFVEYIESQAVHSDCARCWTIQTSAQTEQCGFAAA